MTICTCGLDKCLVCGTHVAPTTRKKAIDAMCKSCIYCPHQPGTWRQQVKDCQSKYCPLYPFRPKPRVSITGNQPEGLRLKQQGNSV